MIKEDVLIMTEYTGPVCVLCSVRACSAEPGTKKMPSFCPMPVEAELLEEVEKAYVEQEDLRRLAVESARTEAAGYCRTTRIEDIMDFARRIGATKLGIAHCTGLMHEARLARDIFVANGFEKERIEKNSIESTSLESSDNQELAVGVQQ